MKTVRYTIGALKDLKRHKDVAPRIRRALGEYAAGAGAHAHRVTRLAGSSASRLRVADFRAVFEETEAEIVVTSSPRAAPFIVEGILPP